MTIAVILKGYPRLSETFIAQEIRLLELAGLDLTLVSLRHPYDDQRHRVHAEIEAPVSYLPEYLRDEPRRVARGLAAARRLSGFARARAMVLRDLRRDRTRNRVRRFGQACVAAAEMPAGVTWLYGHFAHTPGSVTRYAATMLGLPYSISAHAKDIWTTPEWELRSKLPGREGGAEWWATCTASGAAHLRALAHEPSKVHLVYHGLDLARFPPAPERSPGGPPREATGPTREPTGPTRILAVGRAVEKKGLDTLLHALAALPHDLDWRFAHIAGGPLLDDLKRLAGELGIAGRCEWLGKRPQAEVLAAYRAADIFALPCRIAGDGDRDGLPNVIVEAQSQRLPVVSTPVSAVPEQIADGVNGLLVPPDDAATLAGALERLVRDPAMRERLGAEGERRVREGFDADRQIERLVALFR